ncbi:OmpA family protein [Rhizobacter sp. SG703]|uniref:OmpA family protein n=1 Tax=Rhizobacter sp. SG703 TaxID=2587140 RepID=UPI0014475C21|nr:OmpA family protein [Rhizobacter sp. SG703]NKI92828.1 outer membrane protein OmpA-like peptidoglycan-associated protein [Rhizobacter sp. SG703]
MDTLSFKSSSLRRAAGLVLATLLAAPLATPLWAQDIGDTRVLKGKNVTESNLLDALTPPPEPVVTRSLKVSRDGAGVSAPERKASASLLITFLTNSSELTESAKQQLDVVAGALKNDRLADYSFNVEGHADPRGNPDANMLLSQQRAESVRDYLVTTHNIAADRLKAEGKGDHDLLNRAVPAAPENRRVTIVTNTK